LCIDAANGDDPKLECTEDSAGSCDQDGECDGNGACRNWAPGTVCVGQACSSHTVYYARVCDGTGVCLGGTNADCSGYECLGSSCRTVCSLQNQCVTTSHYCNGVNQCVSKKGNGSACGNAYECITGQCIDGVCCNNGCTGLCRTCNRAGLQGTCSNVLNNTDSDHECGGLCQVCNGSGGCKNTPSGTDPEDDCSQQAVSTCLRNGECNGAAACANYPAGTNCQWDSSVSEWSTCN
jgi:hypothetical protein